MKNGLNVKTAQPTGGITQLPNLFLGVTLNDWEFGGHVFKDLPIRWFVESRDAPPPYLELIKHILDDEYPHFDELDRINAIAMGLQYFTEAERDQWTAYVKDTTGEKIEWSESKTFSSLTKYAPYGAYGACMSAGWLMMWEEEGYSLNFKVGGWYNIYDHPDMN